MFQRVSPAPKKQKALLAGYKRIACSTKLFTNLKHKKGAAKVQKIVKQNGENQKKSLFLCKQNVL